MPVRYDPRCQLMLAAPFAVLGFPTDLTMPARLPRQPSPSRVYPKPLGVTVLAAASPMGAAQRVSVRLGIEP